MKFKGIYIWYAVPLVLLIVWVAAFYIPLWSSIRTKERELNALKQESQRMDLQTKAMLEMKRNGEQARATLEEFQKELPLIEQLPDVMRTVAAAAKKDGVAVDSFSNIFASVDTGEKLPLATSVFELNLRGRFFEIGRFIEELQSRKTFKNILIGKIAYNEKEYPVLTGKFVVELRAWKGRISSVEGK